MDKPEKIISPDGEQHWYLNGKLHREDGPAVIHPNGRQEWYLNGQPYTFNAWCDKLNKTDPEKAKMLLTYG